MKKTIELYKQSDCSDTTWIAKLAENHNISAISGETWARAVASLVYKIHCNNNTNIQKDMIIQQHCSEYQLDIIS